MRYLIILLSITMLTGQGFAQRKKKNDAPQTQAATPTDTTKATTPTPVTLTEYQVQEKIFDLGLRYKDGLVAKQALFNMIALNPDNPALKDTLAMLYFNLGKYAETVLVTRDILSERPNDLAMTEIQAISEQNLGLNEKALLDFENLYIITKNISYLYEIASLQYQLNRLEEANTTIDALIKETEAEKRGININVGQRSQTVPLKSAGLNLKGVLAANANNITLARQYFNEALRLAPDFVLPKENLEDIKPKPAAPAKKKTK